MNTQPEESDGIKLLKKGQNGLIHALFSRLGLMLLLLLLQFSIIIVIFFKFEEYIPHFTVISTVISIIIVLCLLNNKMDPTAKITWLILMLVIPVFGVFFYWYIQSDFGHRALKQRFTGILKMTNDKIPQSENVIKQLEQENSGTVALNRYIQRTGTYPIYDNTDVTYFPLGEDKFQEMLIQLKQAKHFIFMEYFIVNEGHMWGNVLEILAMKAAEGVDVRIMYDGTCEFALLPHDYPKRLSKLGIKCKIFAPVAPFISTHYNYRDHRKILVIDGHTAFNGGINLADEYINRTSRFGHWKDTAVMIKGDAVKSFTLMFLQMWNIDVKNAEYDKFLSYPTASELTTFNQTNFEDTANAAKTCNTASGYVMPYGDCPLDEDNVGEWVYMDILNRATRYVHIMTPYLILDGSMESTLKFAAKRGIDVTIIMPGIPDKIVPYALAKSHYASLLEAGIKIYEYTPGFVHAKVFVSDDETAVVGTINLDYRSFYHHFECATYMYKSNCITDIEADFQHTLAQCRQVTPETIRKEKLSLKIMGFLFKAVAPLL